MSAPSQSPFEAAPPSAGRLVRSIVLAIVGAVLLLVLVVLPAEYGTDPTGFGPVRTLTVKDVVGGNEKYREVALPDPRDPVPLPNPAVAQIKQADPQERTITITLQRDDQTEIKTILDEAQVILYSWRAEGGEVYTDFHGHDPLAGDAFVRYEEQQSGNSGKGSLVAPFAGEHGWYWLNISDGPVTITLRVSGYFNEIKDYGILKDPFFQ
jgi:hypothetical protein